MPDIVDVHPSGIQRVVSAARIALDITPQNADQQVMHQGFAAVAAPDQVEMCKVTLRASADAGFLEQFANGGIAHGFAPFHMATREPP